MKGLSQGDMKELYSLFDAGGDGGGDGIVTWDEIEAVLCPAEKEVQEKTVDARIEWLKFELQKRSVGARDLFKYCDGDNTNTIKMNELKLGLEHFKVIRKTFPKEQLEALFECFDDTGDGVIQCVTTTAPLRQR